jgi:hypothetical protein
MIRSRFGLLANCDHAFCLKCIRTWRQQNLEVSHPAPNPPSEQPLGIALLDVTAPPLSTDERWCMWLVVVVCQGQDMGNVRSCPVCKVLSPFVLPCTRHVTDPYRKEALIRIYKAAAAQRRCKYYEYG